MKLRWVFGVVLAILLSGCATISLDNDAETAWVKEIAQEVCPSVAYVHGIRGHGSGVAVYKDSNYTYFVTNYHVVAGMGLGGRSTLQTYCGKELVGTVVAQDDLYDVAVLRVSDPTLSVVPLVSMDDAVKVYDRVWAVGFPLGAGYTITEGRLMPTRGKYERYDLMHTAPIAPGNSGGPLVWYDPVEQRMEVLGLNSAVALSQHGIITHLSLAIGPEKLRKVLAERKFFKDPYALDF